MRRNFNNNKRNNSGFRNKINVDLQRLQKQQQQRNEQISKLRERYERGEFNYVPKPKKVKPAKAANISQEAKLVKTYAIEHKFGNIFMKKQNKYVVRDITSSLERGVEKAIQMTGYSLEQIEEILKLEENGVTLSDLLNYIDNNKKIDISELFYASSATSFNPVYFTGKLSEYAAEYISRR